jgi:2-polyprenyl-3-methyl-5-hydroxy-6-metoxy-1,4-benzoquinol methylase
VRLTSQDYWEKHWQQYTELDDLGGGCELFDDVAPFLPPGEGKTFFEVGCAPGRILADFCGRLGFTAHGLDFASDPEVIERNLGKAGIKVGKVHRADFFSWQPEERYDVVASFGFIEHFDDAARVVDRHFEIVKPGGMVVIGMPNFGGAQRALHWLFDRKNLLRHNTRIMNLPFLEEAARRNRAEIVQARYTGGHFSFWLDEEAPLIARKVVWKVVPPLRGVANRVVPGESNPWFSPFLFAIYRAPGADSSQAAA